MIEGNTYKLAFLGEPGAGKTTCVASVSEIEPLSTDVATTDELAMRKAVTTVAMDYGEMSLGDGNRLLLYGLPGQSRFRYMFDVVRENLVGLVVLVDAKSPAPLLGLADTLECYVEELGQVPFVVAINKLPHDDAELRRQAGLVLRRYGLVGPVISVDARRKEDLALMFELILLCAEYGDA